MNYSPPSKPPIPTKEKREQRFLQSIDWVKVKDRSKDKSNLVIPGVDLPAMRRQWGPEKFGYPQLFKGDFMVPIEYGSSSPQCAKVCYEQTKKWINEMAKQSLTFHSLVRIYPGIYPAFDVRDQCPVLDKRQFIVEAYFRSERPKLIELEIDPRLVEPYTIQRGPRPSRKG